MTVRQIHRQVFEKLFRERRSISAVAARRNQADQQASHRVTRSRVGHHRRLFDLPGVVRAPSCDVRIDCFAQNLTVLVVTKVDAHCFRTLQEGSVDHSFVGPQLRERAPGLHS